MAKISKNHFLPGEPVLVETGSGIAYCCIRSHANVTIASKSNIRSIKHIVEVNHPQELKGRLFSVCVTHIKKISGDMQTNWQAVKVACGWIPDSLGSWEIRGQR